MSKDKRAILGSVLALFIIVMPQSALAKRGGHGHSHSYSHHYHHNYSSGHSSSKESNTSNHSRKSTQQGATASQSLSLYEKPDLSGKVIASVKKGAKLTVIDTSSYSGVYQVNYAGKLGYVGKYLVKFS